MTKRTVSTVSTVSTASAPPAPADPLRLRQALDAKRAELDALPSESLIDAYGLEPSAASSVVAGAIARLEPHLPALVAQYGAEGERLVRELPVVALAVEQANVEVAAAESDSDLREGHQLLCEVQQLLETDLDGAANRKLIDRSRIDPGRGKMGYRAVVMGVLVLVALARESWGRIGGKVALTAAEIDAAEAAAQAQLARLNHREQGVTRMQPVETRRRAVTLLIRHYGEVRRMITYVRWWEGDADVIAPSLWSGRRRKRTEDTKEPISPGPTEPGGPFTS